VRRDTNTDTPLPPDEPLAENPPDGAPIDYYLAQAASGPVTLEILDSAGKLVRRYASTDAPEPTAADLKTLAIPTYWVRRPRTLSAAAGLHRWIWDLHGAPPESMRHGYPISAVPHDTPRLPLGPRALPGVYTVKLTADGHTETASLTVKMDPRVKATPAALAQLHRAEVELAGLITRTTEAIREAHSAQEQIEKRSDLADLGKQLKDLLGAGGMFGPVPPKPGLMSVNGQASMLYGSLDGADAAPTAAQSAAVAQLVREAPAVIQRWEKLKEQLKAKNVELKSGSKQDDGDDEDDDVG